MISGWSAVVSRAKPVLAVSRQRVRRAMSSCGRRFTGCISDQWEIGDFNCFGWRSMLGGAGSRICLLGVTRSTSSTSGNRQQTKAAETRTYLG